MGLFVVSILVVNGVICCFNLGGEWGYLVFQSYNLGGEWGYLLFQPYILGGECFFLLF